MPRSGRGRSTAGREAVEERTALQSALDETYPGKFEINIVDIWTDYAPWPYSTFVPAYQFLAKNPFWWRCLWAAGLNR